jgi:helicase
MRRSGESQWSSDTYRACYELVARPDEITTRRVRGLIGAVRRGDRASIERTWLLARQAEADALALGPDEWVSQHLFTSLVERFARSNIRAVLPDGDADHWDPLVRSLLNRRPAVWDFFPSQIGAITAGLLTSSETFSLQMPTGAGKTALTEALLFSHLTAHRDAIAVLLVPYRSLARELRNGLAKNLTAMGLPTRAIYGGTVPSREEVHGLEGIRAVVATPEALSGVLSTSAEMVARISLVVCDEGHLLDAGTRGVGLELLLARMRRRATDPPRFVFVSAIVPNIEEINAWLGGSDRSVIKSDFRPSTTEYGILRPIGKGAKSTVSLELQPQLGAAGRHTLSTFLQPSDFQYYNTATHRTNTYSYSSVKTQAIAAARKALALGTVAVFAATKTGNQGAVGLAEELLAQLGFGLQLPLPLEYVEDSARLPSATEYLEREYGGDWVGTRILGAGGMLHHGDIPQETREVLEKLLVAGLVRIVICTNTLAEGVNLPIRTLVLYSVRRRSATGRATSMLARDIKNLVGRAGRAGVSTRGLVICANPNQWQDILPVASQQPGERVSGALLDLISRLKSGLSRLALSLTNEILESETELFSLVDGIDSTLIELAADELGDEEFLELARSLAAETFAAQQADTETKQLLDTVFELRARRVVEVRALGRVNWVRETGTRMRLLDSVANDLIPRHERWDDIASPLDGGLLGALLDWAWGLPEVRIDLEDAYRGEVPGATQLRDTVVAWLEGKTLAEMAQVAGLDIDTMLRVHAKVVGHALVVAVEQGVGLLARFLAESGQGISDAVLDLPGHLRFGVPSSPGRLLASGGVRHRRAAVLLGRELELAHVPQDDAEIFSSARRLLDHDPDRWLSLLGSLMYENTLLDVREPRTSPSAPR